MRSHAKDACCGHAGLGTYCPEHRKELLHSNQKRWHNAHRGLASCRDLKCARHQRYFIPARRRSSSKTISETVVCGPILSHWVWKPLKSAKKPSVRTTFTKQSPRPLYKVPRPVAGSMGCTINLLFTKSAGLVTAAAITPATMLQRKWV
mmetsp:Transcript_13299/g.17996  ORF Transcript_13299/g.17996 Transcript_13299/m.17996 type:complete len:149 (-) Transcript_13299:58-504(-)